jgi:hypothetical protein
MNTSTSQAVAATLTNLPAREKEHTLECIGAGPGYLAISNAIWTGLALTEVFQAARVQVSPGTIELVFRSVDEYSTSIPVEDLLKPAWLVWRMNGVALPTEHGYPVRLLVPGRYGTQWVGPRKLLTNRTPWFPSPSTTSPLDRSLPMGPRSPAAIRLFPWKQPSIGR